MADKRQAVQNLKKCQLDILEYTKKVALSCDKLYNLHFFMSAIAKKAVDIIDGIIDASEKNNISVQISLMRLLIDCCLATKASSIIGIDRCVGLIKRGKKFGDYRNKEDDRKLTDSYLKKEIDKDFNDFEKLYDWACKGVHFSDLALKSLFVPIIIPSGEKVLTLDLKIGNNELASAILTNCKTTETIGRLIIAMMEKYMVQKGDLGSPVTIE